MSARLDRRPPGEVRDAVRRVLQARPSGASVGEIVAGVHDLIGDVSGSSIRSYLRLNTPGSFIRPRRGYYQLVDEEDLADNHRSARHRFRTAVFDRATVVHADCMEWLKQHERASVHAVVTDPPYGLVEYSSKEQEKLRNGTGGVWRIPPSFDGAERSPVPRFTVLSLSDVRALAEFFLRWARLLAPVLVPGANVVVASNPLLSYVVSGALAEAGLERRGEIVRLVMTMRGGDRPKGAHGEFSDVSVMPRSMWEPWLVFRKPLEGRVQDNLRKWRTGGFRRPSADRPIRGRDPFVSDSQGGTCSGAASKPEASRLPAAVGQGASCHLAKAPFLTHSVDRARRWRQLKRWTTGVSVSRVIRRTSPFACQAIPRLTSYERDGPIGLKPCTPSARGAS